MTKNKFNLFGIDESIINALDVLGYTSPTEVQKEVVPLLLEKKDIVVQSQTGSGKTAAFGIPACDTVEWEERYPQVLILTPTRELATQIQDELFNIGRYKRLKVVSLFGKSSYQMQVKQLKQRTHIVVATPGRLYDHIMQKTINLSKINQVIIDEADEMFAMGFIEQLDQIMPRLPKKRTTALFSATMPDAVKRLSKKYLHNPVYVEIKKTDDQKKRISQYYQWTADDEKSAQFEDTLIVENPETSIIFCNTKIMVEELTKQLKNLGVNCEMLHGGMEQRDRTRVIKDYKRGYIHCLVATDVAARGIDVSDIKLVVNYDIPDKVETYTHRIGRTARFEKSGKAISFVNSKDKFSFKAIMAKEGDSLEEMRRPNQELVKEMKRPFLDRQLESPKLRKEKGLSFKEDIMKIHINAGKKQKMRAGDIVGALCQIDGMTADDIGVIDLLDISTFVDILNGKGDLVLKTLQTKPIKGRLRKVNQSNITKYEQDLQKYQR